MKKIDYLLTRVFLRNLAYFFVETNSILHKFNI